MFMFCLSYVLANQTGIDLQEAFDKKLDLKTKRDHDRHKNNPKLK